MQGVYITQNPCDGLAFQNTHMIWLCPPHVSRPLPDDLYKVVMRTIVPSDVHRVQRLRHGKVREIYPVDDAQLPTVATDRLAAFAVGRPTPIPDKGRMLTTMAHFWCARTAGIVLNHLTTRRLDAGLTPEEVAQVGDRAVIVRRMTPLPVEAMVRGYLTGSACSAYRRDGTVCGIALPAGLRASDQLLEPMCTPSTKAPAGAHDRNIAFEAMVQVLGGRHALAAQIQDASLRVYGEARD